MTGQPGQDDRDRNAMKGLPEQDSGERTPGQESDDTVELPEQDVRTGLPVIGMLGQDYHGRTARTGKPGQGFRAGMPGQHCQDRNYRAGLLGQES
jgi:hypothetical protein